MHINISHFWVFGTICLHRERCMRNGLCTALLTAAHHIRVLTLTTLLQWVKWYANKYRKRELLPSWAISQIYSRTPRFSEKHASLSLATRLPSVWVLSFLASHSSRFWFSLLFVVFGKWIPKSPEIACKKHVWPSCLCVQFKAYANWSEFAFC